MPGTVGRLAALPRTRSPLTCPRVVVTGDFFTRFSPFFMEGVAELCAKRGVILRPVELSDLLLYGETIPTVGKGLDADSEGHDGIIVIGPFNCLPYRISEAILKPLSLQRGNPILTRESDGYAVSPSFLRQVDLHVQQVLNHAAKTRG